MKSDLNWFIIGDHRLRFFNRVINGLGQRRFNLGKSQFLGLIVIDRINAGNVLAKVLSVSELNCVRLTLTTGDNIYKTTARHADAY